MLRKGIVRSFDSATYKATVQVVGSGPTYLTGVPVSKAIPAIEMVDGAKCVLLFFDLQVTADGVVVAVYP